MQEYILSKVNNPSTELHESALCTNDRKRPYARVLEEEGNGNERKKGYFYDRCFYYKKDCCRRFRCPKYQEDRAKGLKSSTEEQPEKALLSGEIKNSLSCIVDLGASSHMMKNSTLYTGVRNRSTEISTAGSERILAISKGKSSVDLGDSNVIVNLDRVIHVPTISADLFSVSQLCDEGYNVRFTKELCEIYKSNRIIRTGIRDGNIYKIYAHSLGRS